jgi:riboflavin kinase
LKAGNGSSSNLDRVDTGVYFGWAMLEHGETAFSVPYKAVVNVGYSPTFEGQENPEKIIEAHLITPQDDDDDDDLLPDFYGTPLRLQLVGFLRDEQKFDSLSDLMAQIHADVRDARDALECDPYDRCRQDDFFRVDRWVGKGDGDASGGDDQASWESQTMTEFLNAL